MSKETNNIIRLNLKIEGINLLRQGKIDAAKEIIDEYLKNNSQDIEALNLISYIAVQKKIWQKAYEIQEKIHLISPNDAKAHNNSGFILSNLNRYKEALERYEKAIELNQEYVEAYINKGIVLQDLNRNTEALLIYDKVISLDKKNIDAYNNKANTLAEMGRYEEALHNYEKALEINNNYSDIYNNKGNALKELGRLEEALLSYKYAVGLDKQNSNAYFNKAVLLREMSRLEEALNNIDESININIDSEAYCVRGHIMRELCNEQEAKNSYQKAIEINQHCLEARWGIPFSWVLPIEINIKKEEIHKKFNQELNKLDIWIEKNKNKIQMYEGVGTIPPFYLAYSEINNKKILSKYGEICVKIMSEWQKLNKLELVEIKKKDKNKKIKIGIVGEQIRNHSVWNAITRGIVLKLNKEKFEVIIFKLGLQKDNETEIAKQNSDLLISGNKNLIDWSRHILENSIDILIYPEIGMHQQAIQLASMRLASIQIASWGHPETTGLATIDYYLSAELFENNNSEKNYTEKLINLPNLGCYYEKVTKQENIDPYLSEITESIIICPGSLFKYLPKYDWVLREIVIKANNCKLIFFYQEKAWEKILYKRLKNVFISTGHNIDDYVLFIPYLPINKFVSLLNKSAIYLDTISFSGFNTAMLAIESGLPVVTLKGEFLRSRLASGVLERIELNELIAFNEKEYIDIAVELLNNKQKMSMIREKIIKNKEVLYKDSKVIEELENFFLEKMKNNN
jgi:predicted O-linked N-acetylglucosamine transferase (SPINDLY family)